MSRKSEFATAQRAAYRKAAKQPPGWAIETRLDASPGIVPEAIPRVPRAKAEPSKPGRVVVHKVNLTDTHIEAVQHLAENGQPYLLCDINTGKRGERASTPGLRIRIGPRSATWLFYRDVLDHGRRIITSKMLGRFPDMNTDTAREKAQVIGGQIAGGKRLTGARTGTKFGAVFDAYLVHLAEGTADEEGISADEKRKRKPGRWHRNVRSLGTKYLLPKFKNWTLAEMSERREEVGQWYRAIANDSVSTAHHLRRVIRAIYNWRIEEGEDLTGINPARAKIKKVERHKQKGHRKPSIPLDQFPAWLAEWRKLPPMNRAYHLAELLCGARPGELVRTIWPDLDTKAHTVTIGNSKNGSDIVIPLSGPIMRAFDLAREAARADGIKSELIFPGPNNEHWAHRDPLPNSGMDLRRTYKTVASSLLIPNETSGRLLGHRPPGVSAGYEDPLEVQRAAMLRDLQGTVSARMLSLFGCDPTTEKIAPLPPSPREAARAAGRATYKSDQPCPAGHVGERSVATNRCVECVRLKNIRQKPNRARRRAA